MKVSSQDIIKKNDIAAILVLPLYRKSLCRKKAICFTVRIKNMNRQKPINNETINFPIIIKVLKVIN